MAKKYLDSDGLLYLWQKIKNLFTLKADSVASITRSGTTFTAKNSSGTSLFTFDQQDNTATKTSTTPLMDGTAAIGSETAYAAGDHVHPSDTSRVPTTRTVNGHALSTDVTVTKSDVGLGNVTDGAQPNVIETVKVNGTALTPDSNKAVNITTDNVGAIATSEKGAINGVCPLNSLRKVDSTYLPSYVDDVVEAYARSGQTALSQNWLATGSASGTVITPETGKIYILMADSGDYAANSQFRWSGTTYVKMADGGVSSITNSEIDTIVAS